MRISTRGRYGMAAMLDLAIHYPGEAVTLNSISQRQGIPENYLEQLFHALRKAGLIKSVRGPHGGYMLAKGPENITVGMVLRVLEGSLAPVGCVDENKPEKCARVAECVTQYVWKNIRDEINRVVDAISLKTLADEYRRLTKSNNIMYYI